MGFLVYDLIFLAGFLIFSSVFLYTRKRNLKKEGLLFLYKTSWGIKLINYVGKKNNRTLHFLSYVSIISGYFLMIGIFWLIYRIVAIYAFQPAIVRAIKVPPIIPLVPYLPQVFNLDFLPPFYFTYWIVILAIVAISHEVAHGIFAAHNDVKIKTTGFGFFPFFLPIFLAAFVELDEVAMAKKKKFAQMAILAAGTFANVLVAALFFIIIFFFFSFAFTPTGITFDGYATSTIAITSITSVGNIALDNPTHQQLIDILDENLSEIKSQGQTYLATKTIIENQFKNDIILLYQDGPAIREGLSSVILDINGERITSIEELQQELNKYVVGEEITIKVLEEEDRVDKKIVLTEHPKKPGNVWLGVGFINPQQQGAMGKLISLFSFKEPHTYYEPKFDDLSVFIYNLLWWLVIISISVALMNMLPVGIFDGGRFFYLTVWSLTGNEKIAKRAFRFSTSFFLFLLLLIMIFWAISWF